MGITGNIWKKIKPVPYEDVTPKGGPPGTTENINAREAAFQIEYQRYVQSSVTNGNDNYLTYQEWRKHKVAQ